MPPLPFFRPQGPIPFPRWRFQPKPTVPPRGPETWPGAVIGPFAGGARLSNEFSGRKPGPSPPAGRGKTKTPAFMIPRTRGPVPVEALSLSCNASDAAPLAGHQGNPACFSPPKMSFWGGRGDCRESVPVLYHLLDDGRKGAAGTQRNMPGLRPQHQPYFIQFFGMLGPPPPRWFRGFYPSFSPRGSLGAEGLFGASRVPRGRGLWMEGAPDFIFFLKLFQRAPGTSICPHHASTALRISYLDGEILRRRSPHGALNPRKAGPCFENNRRFAGGVSFPQEGRGGKARGPPALSSNFPSLSGQVGVSWSKPSSIGARPQSLPTPCSRNLWPRRPGVLSEEESGRKARPAGFHVSTHFPPLPGHTAPRPRVGRNWFRLGRGSSGPKIRPFPRALPIWAFGHGRQKNWKNSFLLRKAVVPKLSTRAFQERQDIFPWIEAPRKFHPTWQ